MTSNAALQEVKRLYQARKAGHTGSLDPLANGLLPICLGAATKVSAYLLGADKRYWVRARLGVKTTTADAEGETIEVRSTEAVDKRSIEAVLPAFTGAIQQLPPMFSALKQQGQRLYKLARAGVEVEREPREIHIHALTLEAVSLPEIDLKVHCSKGTYVRTLVEDIGEKLGCGAHVTALRRTAVGPYVSPPMQLLEDLVALARDGLEAIDRQLLPLDSALGKWPEVRLSADAAYYLKRGQAVTVPKAPTSGMVRLYDNQAAFLGLGEVEDDGRIAPRRLMINS
jgi:tRNA pseudouridine55 synthase